jgi:hypothetical protein
MPAGQPLSTTSRTPPDTSRYTAGRGSQRRRNPDPHTRTIAHTHTHTHTLTCRHPHISPHWPLLPQPTTAAVRALHVLRPLLRRYTHLPPVRFDATRASRTLHQSLKNLFPRDNCYPSMPPLLPPSPRSRSILCFAGISICHILEKKQLYPHDVWTASSSTIGCLSDRKKQRVASPRTQTQSIIII